MSDEELSTPAKVELVAWSGDVAQLAARLNMPEMELLTRLRRLSPGRPGSRLVVMATPVNSGPIMAALMRRLHEGTVA